MPNGARHWVFTLNNYLEDELLALHGVHDQGLCKYICWGREIGDSGTPHLQGFVSFARQSSMGGIKRRLPLNRAHLEICRGTPAQAIEYCQKDGDFVEFGERPASAGHRSDLRDLQRRLESGATTSQISDEFFSLFLRYPGAIIRKVAIEAEKHHRVQPPKIEVFWGPTGTGKSRRARTLYPGAFWYSSENVMWFDGYETQETVVFDDYDGSQFPLRFLLRLLDYNPVSVPIKGGTIVFKAKTVIFTSNFHPKEWYAGAKAEHQRALKRRILEFGTITHFNEPIMPPATQEDW